MHKKHQRGDNSKSNKELSFLYATHRHDLFYITVKYHQNIPNGIQVIKRTRKCLRTDGQMTDGRQAHRYITRTFRSGDKKLEMSTIICAKHMVSEASVCSKLIGSWNLLTRFRCSFLTDKTR